MSFGLGLVKGLVGGFTRNIEEERQARAADDQRLATLEDTLFAAALDPKKKVTKELGNMLKEAQTTLEDRGSIDIFGRAGPRLKLDMDKLQNVINTVDDKKFITYGTPDDLYKITPFSQEMFEDSFMKNPLEYSRAWLQSFDTHFERGGKAEVDKFIAFMNKKKNSLSKTKFLKDWTKYTSEYKLRSGQDYTTEGIKATRFPDIVSRHLSAGLLKDFLNEKPFSEEDAEIEALYKDEENKEKQQKNKNMFDDTKFDSNKTIFLKGNDDAYRPFVFVDEEDGLTANQKLTALKALAKKNGFGESGRELSKFIIAYRQLFEKPLPNLKIALLEGDKFASPEIVRVEYSDLFHSINLQHLGAGKKLVNMEDRGAAVLSYLKDNFTFRDDNDKLVYDKARAVRALAAVTVVPESDIERLNDQDAGTTATGLSEFAEDMFFNTIGVKASEFLEKFEATKKTVDGIEKLKTLKLEEGSAAGTLVAWVKSTLGNIIVPTGAISQISEFISGSPGRNKLKKGTTKESLIEIMERLNKEEFGGKLIQSVANLSEQEAYMITLAADMARAVDPSGRLSNQDFEVQLRRLGKQGLFSSKIAEMSALKQVEEDFKRRYKRIESIAAVLADSSGGGKRLTKLELQVLHANKKYNTMEDLIFGTDVTITAPSAVPTVDEIRNEKIVDGDVERPRYFFIKRRELDNKGRPTQFYDRKTNNRYSFEYDANDNIINIKLLTGA